ncbi:MULTISPECIES: hypothetical protein [Microbacterium]|uniref:hypothetical protein n=1 Tax=Microbacterium TaxID=33882 RepID=UPI0023DA3D60|nr:MULTISPECIES: hypothetical protein [Microbacterium]MDF2048059.1 hypothetical protein [Microbacterium sp. Kw_RZR3]MDF2919466.1 hypothetical protein [Microbacterium sp.]MDQ1084716.1 hypothetical protein [Microbacterium sp. SORGH_AS_0344]MDQ1170007.1 hypothetical protein [Microbacterium proteolyticum]
MSILLPKKEGGLELRFWEELLHAISGRASTHRQLPDLRNLPSHSVAVIGTQYLVNDVERQDVGDRLYVLRSGKLREGRARSVAVFSNGRNLGRLSPEAAQPLAAALAKLGGAAVVNGTGVRTSGIRLWVDVPDTDALNAFAAYWQLRE